MNTFLVGLSEVTNCEFVDSINDGTCPLAASLTFSVLTNQLK
jgi:hypothetical protein